MTDELKPTQADAYLYENDEGSRELIFNCNGERAQRLLEFGYRETPLYAHPASQPSPDVVELREAGWRVAKEIAASALQAACEADPADPEHPDTVMLTTGDLETIVRCAVENWQEAASLTASNAAREALEKADALIEQMHREKVWCSGDVTKTRNVIRAALAGQGTTQKDNSHG